MLTRACMNFDTGYCHSRERRVRFGVNEFEGMDKNTQTHVEPMCVDCQSPLAFHRRTAARCAFFRHATSNAVSMTDWHRRWQSYFSNTEVSVENRIADVKLSDTLIMELQHSKISADEVRQRTCDYESNGLRVLWLVDASEMGTTHVSTVGDSIQIDFWRSFKWILDKWKCCRVFYINLRISGESIVCKIAPDRAKSYMCTIGPSYTYSEREFVRLLSTHDESVLFSDEFDVQFRTDVFQAGCGAGKTYGSVQDADTAFLDHDAIVADNVAILERLDKMVNRLGVTSHDTVTSLTYHLIFITDKHSAKAVIRKEFEDQESRDALVYLRDKDTAFSETEENSPKFVREYFIGKFKLVVIIGTVASFIASVAPRNPPNGCEQVSDIFMQNYFNLKAGGVRDMTIDYGGHRIRLCQRVKVYADEAQDLPSVCAEAMFRMQADTSISLYFVGDVMQALTEPENAMTYFATNHLQNATYHKDTFEFRRGRHPAFVEFMRAVIPYEKHQCPPPERWVPDGERRQQHAYNPIIYMPLLKANCDKDAAVLENARRVCALVGMLVERHNYLPEDFIIPVGYVTNNVLAAQIQDVLIAFFADKLRTDCAYRQVASDRSEHWRKILPTNAWKSEDLCVFHKSDEGKPIDTTISNHGVRIVSIFAAKGDGRPVSIVVGVNEQTLCLYRNHPTVYDSLLNVAVTRAKDYMVWAYQNKDDKIYKQMTKYTHYEHYQPIGETERESRTSASKLPRFVEEILQNHFEQAKLLIPPRFASEKPQLQLVDHNYHNIRARVAQYKVMQHLIPRRHQPTQTNRCQPQTIMKMIVWRLQTRVLASEEYWPEINQEIKQRPSCIPLRKDESGNSCTHLIERYCKHIQRRFSAEPGVWPDLCPIETVVFLYMYHIVQDGSATVISWWELVRIMRDAREHFGDQYGEEEDTRRRIHAHCICSGELSNAKTGKMKGPLTTHFSHTESVTTNLNMLRTTLQASYGVDICKMELHLNKKMVFDIPGYIELKLRVSLTANNDTHDVFMYFIPNLSDLNWSEHYMTTIAHDYLMQRGFLKERNDDDEDDKRDDKDRFGGKRRIFVLFSLYEPPRIIHHAPESHQPAMDAIVTSIVRAQNHKNNIQMTSIIAEYATAHRGYSNGFMELERQIRLNTNCDEHVINGLKLRDHHVKWLYRTTGKIEDGDWCEEKVRGHLENGEALRTLDDYAERMLMEQPYYKAT